MQCGHKHRKLNNINIIIFSFVSKCITTETCTIKINMITYSHYNIILLQIFTMKNKIYLFVIIKCIHQYTVYYYRMYCTYQFPSKNCIKVKKEETNLIKFVLLYSFSKLYIFF